MHDGRADEGFETLHVLPSADVAALHRPGPEQKMEAGPRLQVWEV